MTREEAIKELQESHDIMRSYDIDESESRLMTALDMAINALEQEPCDDAISRQAVYEVLDSMLDDSSDSKRNQLVSLDSIADEIAELPPVNPQEPKTGHWIEHEKGFWSWVNKNRERDGWIPDYECSECGSRAWKCKTNYCPQCGARMVEPQESEDKG